jgi:hypothetical protein
VRLTYLEVRLLLDDLKLQPKDKEPAAPSPLTARPASPTTAPAAGQGSTAPAPAASVEGDPIQGMPGEVSVTVDQITRAGAVVSGKVRFSDGKSAEWYLDQMGRLGLAPAEKGYRPSQQDVMAFQVELQNVMAQMGF